MENELIRVENGSNQLKIQKEPLENNKAVCMHTKLLESIENQRHRKKLTQLPVHQIVIVCWYHTLKAFADALLERRQKITEFYTGL